MAANRFWSDFKTHYWEKHPVVIDDVGRVPVPHLTESQIFATTLQVVRQARKRNYRVGFLRLYVNGEPVEITTPAESLLPSPRDGSFSRYDTRLSTRGDIKEYALIITNFHRFDEDLWKTLCIGLKPLFSTMGLPESHVDASLFLGNYSRTPIGVHVDECGILHLPVVGTKRIRLWTSQYVAKHPDLENATTYPGHLRQSVLLEARPGALIYWPSDRWHIGESTKQFHATWGLGYWFAASTDHVDDERIVSDERRRELDQRALDHVSSHAFKVVPPAPRVTPLTEVDVVRVDPDFPLVWMVRHNGECLISCRGRSVSESNGAWCPLLLQLLNAGETVSIRELRRRFADSRMSARKLLSLLQAIQRIGGFRNGARHARRSGPAHAVSNVTDAARS